MRRRALSALALAVALGILITGCGPINAGSASADRFREYMADQPGVADVQIAASNDLPFQGSASGTVVLDDGADESTLSAVMDRMAGYLRDRAGNVSWWMVAEVDGFTVHVSAVDEENRAIVDLLGQARAIDGIVGGRLGSADRSEPANDLVIEDPAQFVATLKQLVKLGFASAVRVRDVDSTFAVTSTDGRQLPEPEIAAYEAVSAVYPVLGATLAPGSVVLRLAADHDVAAATALGESLATSAGIAFTITGGIVTREGEGDFTLVDSVIARLIDVQGTTALTAKHDTLGITVDTTAAMVTTEAVLAELDPASTLTVYYRSADTVTPGFRVYGKADRRATYIPVVTALVSGGYLDSIEVDADRIDVVAGAYDAARMAELAGTLKRLVPTGEPVRLTNVDGGVNFSFVAGDVINVPSDESYGDVDASAFVAAWNSAP
ncbi:MAG: hypothetical protein ABJB03_10930 [Rhodoglobus sp.]